MDERRLRPPAGARVRIVEVGARDGLQNEKTPLATATKLELIRRLAAAGLRDIEATAFVSPRWVPQMADHARLMAAIAADPALADAGINFPVLAPNMKGYEAAVAAGAKEVAVFAAASEGFSKKNINCSIAESIERFAPVARAARDAGMKVRGAISCCLGCPYQGEVKPEAVGYVARLMHGIGVEHVGVADTIGVGTPGATKRALEAALAVYPIDEVSGHFHDTYGMALANVCASLDMGISTFDASVAGLGGCPYAKGATGNVATEDVVYLMHGLGIATGIDLAKLRAAGRAISASLGRATSSRVAKALDAKSAA